MNNKIKEKTGVSVPDINFKDAIFQIEGGNAAVVSADNVTKTQFLNYVSDVLNLGWTKFEENYFGENVFVILSKDNDSLYLSYYPNISQIRIVVQPNCKYTSFKYENAERTVKPLFTQIHLEDFGLSDVIRLSDGKFVVIDGGNEVELEADYLMNCLKRQSPYEKPVIAMWIITHEHSDHYGGFLAFYEKYREEVKIESFLLNFVDAKPEFKEIVPELQHEPSYEKLDFVNNLIENSGIPVIRAHTGQVFELADMRFEVISGPDDNVYSSVCSPNTLSLIFKVYVEGQTLLIPGDSFFEYIDLEARYGNYLKCDILQIPHHGFGGGTVEGYDLINPDVCVVPVSEVNFFTINSQTEWNIHLVHNLNVKEFFTGEKDVTLELPYTYKENGRKIMLDLAERHRKGLGAYSWTFMDLTSKDCDFEILNLNNAFTEIYIELYFTESKNNVRFIRYKAKCGLSKLNILSPEDVETDVPYYNPWSLAKNPVKDGVPFTARFRSNVPIIVKGKNKADFWG